MPKAKGHCGTVLKEGYCPDFCSQVSAAVQRKFKNAPPPFLYGSRFLKAAKKSNLPTQSAAANFLDQTFGLVPANERPSTPDVLYTGTSLEGTGRKEYLKRRANQSIKERYVYPIAESMTYGLETPRKAQYELHHNRKPIIRDNFFRKQGLCLHEYANPHV